MQFKDLPLAPVFLKAIAAQGYERPTPIQQKAIEPALKGRDLVAVAQTGTGKTAAFALPALQWLYDTPPPPSKSKKKPLRCLVLSPTRELASQIEEGFKAYGKGTDFRTQVIFGGVNQNPQVRQLKRGNDILVATPGRLLDLMRQGHIDLRHIEIFILDEADRMLDMGFINDVKTVMAKLPSEKQTLLFSATMPDDINRLAKQFLVKPIRIEVTPPATTVEKIDQSLFHVDKRDKRALLVHLLKANNPGKVLVFTRTKHGANRVAEQLGKAKFAAAAIHGNKSQGARERALRQFKKGELQVLVATDIAARGIDVEGVTHVIQMDLPEVPEQYVHRIGRTARAGASGAAWAFCSVDQQGLLAHIEHTIKMRLSVVEDHPFPPKDTLEDVMREQGDDKRRRSQSKRPRFKKGPGSRPKKKSPHPKRRNKRSPTKKAKPGQRPPRKKDAKGKG